MCLSYKAASARQVGAITVKKVKQRMIVPFCRREASNRGKSACLRRFNSIFGIKNAYHDLRS